jgi:hypothetical protein
MDGAEHVAVTGDEMGEDGPSGPESVPLTSEAAQKALDFQMVNQALLNARSELAQAKVLHRLAEKGCAPELPGGHGHPNQLAEDVKKLLLRVATLIEAAAEIEASTEGLRPPARATIGLALPEVKLPEGLQGGVPL